MAEQQQSFTKLRLRWDPHTFNISGGLVSKTFLFEGFIQPNVMVLMCYHLCSLFTLHDKRISKAAVDLCGIKSF